MTLAVVSLGIAVGILAALVVSLLRSHAEILRVLNDAGIDLDPANGAPLANQPAERVDGSPRNTPLDGSETIEGVPGDGQALGLGVSDITGVTPDGDAVTIGISSAETLVAFLSSGCMTCHRFWEAFATGEELTDGRLEDGTRVIVVTHGEESESPSTVGDLSTPEVPVVMSTDAWEDFGVPVAPYFVLVSGGRVVGEGAAAQWSQVSSLLSKARADIDAVHSRTDRGAVSRRSVITGNRDRIDSDLMAAGIRPGDPRLTHGPQDVGLADNGSSDQHTTGEDPVS